MLFCVARGFLNTPIDISYDEVRKGLSAARRLRAEAWTEWTHAAAKAVAHLAGVAVALVIEYIEAIRRARRRRATIRALSGLPDHILKDIGLSRDSICSVAIEVSGSSRPTRPGRIVAGVTSQYRTKDSIAA